jgi:EAL domain-containing protein (putative c-di-GMP-specific phosphodiesterase class I)
MAAFEDQDLSLKLGEVAFETALKQMRAWLDEGVEFGRVAVNISAAQFRTGRLAKRSQGKLGAGTCRATA